MTTKDFVWREVSIQRPYESEELWDILTQPVAFHDVTLPSTKRRYTFRCYVSSVSDEMEKILDDTVKFKGLTCKYIAKVPARTP